MVGSDKFRVRQFYFIQLEESINNEENMNILLYMSMYILWSLVEAARTLVTTINCGVSTLVITILL